MCSIISCIRKPYTYTAQQTKLILQKGALKSTLVLLVTNNLYTNCLMFIIYNHVKRQLI